MIVSAESADYHSSHPDEYTDAYQTTVNGNTYYWIPWCGTSMSSPLVAGIIALWLQAEPTLTVDQAIEVMQRTARTDFADIEDARWGAGCIDAFAGLKYLLNDGVSDVSTSPAAITVVGRRIVSTAPLTIFDTQGRVYDADSELAPGIYIARTPLTTRKLLLP
jgi:subtilisin family serine protease